MRDPHRDNVFYGYRGAMRYPGAIGEDAYAPCDDPLQSTQIEDNHTRALVFLLLNGGPTVRATLLRRLGVPEERTAIDQEVHAVLQRWPPVAARRNLMKHGHVTGVVAERDIGSRVDNTRPTKGLISRPDATIWGPGFAVVIEAKVHGGLDNEQLERLRNGPTGVSEAPLRVVPDVGWNVLYQDLRALLNRTDSACSEKEAWLTKQFCSYLEYTRMAGFTGFNEDFFDHFTFDEQADDESRRSVLAALRGVGERLTESSTGTSLLYELDPDWALDIGPLTRNDRHAWIAIGAPNKRYRQRPHVSLIFGPSGIHVQANIELKDAVISLRRALDFAPAETLDKMLEATADDPAASIEVIERKQRQAMLYDYLPRVTLDLQTLRETAVQDATFSYFQALVHTLPLPYVTIRRCIPRRDCIDVSRSDTTGSAVTELILDHIRRVTPLVRHLNQH